MATNRKTGSEKTPAKKTATKRTAGKTQGKSTGGKKKRASKKPKVVLNTKSVIILSSIIIAVCVATLVVTAIITAPKKPSAEEIYIAGKTSEQTQEITLENGNDQTKEETKKSSVKKESQKKKDSEKKKSGPKESEKEPKTEIKNTNQQESNQQALNQQKKDEQKKQESVPEINVTSEDSKTYQAINLSAADDGKSKSEPRNESTAKIGTTQTSPTAGGNVQVVEVPFTPKQSTPENDTRKSQTTTVTEQAFQKQPHVASVGKTPATAPTVNELPASKYNIPKAQNGAKLCFVIDDAGLSVTNVKRYTALPFPITIAVLPRLAGSKDCAYAVRAAGKELILHQPMQAHDYPNGKTPDPGPGAIIPDMTTIEAEQIIRDNLMEIGPGVKGFNNHEGSLITENPLKMKAAAKVAYEQGIYFIDSRTTSESAVPEAVKDLNMKYLARYAPFLDNEINRESMLQMLYKGLETANKNGYAIIIGHVDKSVDILPDLLNDIYPYLVKAGYKITTPSSL